MNNSLFYGFVLAMLLSPVFLPAQSGLPAPGNPAQTLSEEEISTYSKQAAQMVSFMEFAFNTLGSSKTEYKEKDIIINQSCLKFFKDTKVQIEDDLVENREVVTNKDLQAYLKDIDFFFNDVVFRFTIEEITQEVNEKGEIFFKVRTSRNLQGVTIEGKQVNDNKPRFIEINLDQARAELKIVSIYTTRSGEEQELFTWWNGLDNTWRNFLAGNTLVLDSVSLRDISSIGPGYVCILTDGFASVDSVIFADTLKVSPSPVLNEIRRILRSDRIDISGRKGFFDLEPLYAFTSLKHLNVGGTSVSGLEPIRNLSKLENLNVSSSLVASIQPLRYCTTLKNLDISSTYVSDIGLVEHFRNLETIDVSGLQFDTLMPVLKLGQLRELRMNGSSVRSVDGLEQLPALELLEISGTAIKDLGKLGNAPRLHRLNLERTYVSDLSPLASLGSLEYIFLDHTAVSNLGPLEGLRSLKSVYCDKTLVDKSEAQAFKRKRPDVRVIYKSEELTEWWNMLSAPWKVLFGKLVQLDKEPTREQLHELISIGKIDVSDNLQIGNLGPLSKLSSLTEVLASNSGIVEINAVSELPELKILDISHNPVTDLQPVAGLTGLEVLKLSSTKIPDLSPVKNLKNLRMLSLDYSPVSGVSPLFGLKRLELLFAEGVPAVEGALPQLWDSIPEALVICMTGRLKTWWDGLPEPWKAVFNAVEPAGANPTSMQLHRIAFIRSLDLADNQNLKDLHPLKMLARLEVLNISRLPVTDLYALASISGLKEFNCSNTPVTDLQPLASHRKMATLNIANTQIDDISVIEGFPALKNLDISGTKVTKLNPVAECLKLERLDCYNTRVSSIKALENMPALRQLRIYNTRVGSKSIEKFKQANPGVEVVYY